jgi:glycosyltransferase involved in cell wall biosynthesis
MEKITTKKPMHVLMTADTVGGVWTYCLQLAKAMEPFNVKYTLVAMGRRCTEAQRSAAAAIKNITLIDSDYKLEWMDNPWDDVEKAGVWLLKLEEELVPDVIHLNGFVHGSLPFEAPKIVVGHSCVFSWWSAVKKGNPPESYGDYFSRVKKGLANADMVIAPSNTMMEALNQYYGTFKIQSVIPNAQGQDFYFKGEKSPFIFTMGRLWDEAKNISLLEEVSEKLEWPVFIAGDSKEPGGFSEMSMSQSKTCFLGVLSKEEIRNHLSRASIFVMPAKYEPFGLSILEAALSGCVLVLGDIPSLRENWNDAAVFINPDDAEELKDVINTLIAHPSQMAKLASKAYIRAAGFFPEKMAQSYLYAYTKLLNATFDVEPIIPQYENSNVLP